MSLAVRIDVDGGDYAGTWYEGELAKAPVTILVPEGIVSARTTAEADRLRSSIATSLATHDRVTIGAIWWHITVSRLATEAEVPS